MSGKPYLCIFVALVLGRMTVADKCPFDQAIAPCTCKNVNNEAHITCTELQNALELDQAFQGMRGKKHYSIKITNSYIGDLRGDAFKDTHFVEVKIVLTKLTSIGDERTPPFSGLERSLERLSIIEAFWDYDKPLQKPIKLDHLKKLTDLKLENNLIPNLGNEWFQNGPISLKSLFISTGLVKEVGNKAFSTLENLRYLHFTGNTVTLKRSALPARPMFLDSLDLSENQVVEFPGDMFTNLPALKFLYIEGNAIQYLPESTYKPILNQLDFLSAESNPLVCDSSMKWIIVGKLQRKIIGACAAPGKLSGRHIKTLTAADFSG